MRVVETYLPGTAGGCCYICRASQRTIETGLERRREMAIDTGRTIDWQGELAVCETCVREAAHLVGLVDPDALRKEQLDHAETKDLLEYTQDRLAATEAALEALRRLDGPAAPPDDVLPVLGAAVVPGPDPFSCTGNACTEGHIFAPGCQLAIPEPVLASSTPSAPAEASETSGNGAGAEEAAAEAPAAAAPRKQRSLKAPAK